MRMQLGSRLKVRHKTAKRYKSKQDQSSTIEYPATNILWWVN